MSKNLVETDFLQTCQECIDMIASKKQLNDFTNKLRSQSNLPTVSNAYDINKIRQAFKSYFDYSIDKGYFAAWCKFYGELICYYCKPVTRRDIAYNSIAMILLGYVNTYTKSRLAEIEELDNILTGKTACDYYLADDGCTYYSPAKMPYGLSEWCKLYECDEFWDEKNDYYVLDVNHHKKTYCYGVVKKVDRFYFDPGVDELDNTCNVQYVIKPTLDALVESVKLLGYTGVDED